MQYIFFIPSECRKTTRKPDRVPNLSLLAYSVMVLSGAVKLHTEQIGAILTIEEVE